MKLSEVMGIGEDDFHFDERSKMMRVAFRTIHPDLLKYFLNTGWKCYQKMGYKELRKTYKPQ
jgi:hypothetical protein